MLTDDASDFVAMVNGYYRLFVDTNKSLVVDVQPVESNDEGRWRYNHTIIFCILGHQGVSYQFQSSSAIYSFPVVQFQKKIF